jgi:hypothetical protein
MKLGFAIPLVCFVIIAAYGMMWKKLEAGDADGSESGDPVMVRPSH